MKRTRLVLTLACTFILITNFVIAQETDLDASIDRGSTIYSSNCASCHMINGTGIQGVYPPLANADSLMNDIPRLVTSVLKGVQGPTVVNGVAYYGAMQSYSLTDKQVADLLNFMRNSWGNEGDAVSPADIQPALQLQERERTNRD